MLTLAKAYIVVGQNVSFFIICQPLMLEGRNKHYKEKYLKKKKRENVFNILNDDRQNLRTY